MECSSDLEIACFYLITSLSCHNSISEGQNPLYLGDSLSLKMVVLKNRLHSIKKPHSTECMLNRGICLDKYTLAHTPTPRYTQRQGQFKHAHLITLSASRHLTWDRHRHIHKHQRHNWIIFCQTELYLQASYISVSVWQAQATSLASY